MSSFRIRGSFKITNGYAVIGKQIRTNTTKDTIQIISLENTDVKKKKYVIVIIIIENKAYQPEYNTNPAPGRFFFSIDSINDFLINLNKINMLLFLFYSNRFGCIKILFFCRTILEKSSSSSPSIKIREFPKGKIQLLEIENPFYSQEIGSRDYDLIHVLSLKKKEKA
ncbi:MAG: hypothetical protein ACFFDT_32370 [Candidatus Hodarchaeota archaeon]